MTRTNYHPTPLRAAPTCMALVLALSCVAARADGHADLRAALARLSAQTPVKGALAVTTIERSGSGKDATEKAGDVALRVEDGPRGLQLTYAPDTLARLDSETRARGRDPEAKTPTVYALKHLDATDIRPLISAAGALSRQIDGGVFKGERTDSWHGRPARVVSFSIPISTLNSEQRKYVKEFEGVLDVWIAADGTPLASASRMSVSGRALIVVSFEANDEHDTTYAVAGDRLLAVRDESHNVSSGAGEHGEQRIVKTLTLE